MRGRGILFAAKISAVVRKIVGGLLTVFMMLQAGCANLDDQVEEVSQWAATQPALSDLQVQQLHAGGIPTDSIQILGAVNVDSVEELCGVLDQLQAKQEEMKDRGVDAFEANLEAEIGGVFFSWWPSLPDPVLIEHLRNVLPRVAKPEVEQVLMTYRGKDQPPEIRVFRRESVGDSDAAIFRDNVYAQLDELDRGSNVVLEGFPLATGRTAAPALDLSGIPLTYTAAYEYVERVEGSVHNLRLVRVGNSGKGTRWEFRGGDEFNEADLRSLKSVLTDPAAGESAVVEVFWADGELGRAVVGKPLDEQPQSEGEWSARMQSIVASET